MLSRGRLAYGTTCVGFCGLSDFFRSFEKLGGAKDSTAPMNLHAMN